MLPSIFILGINTDYSMIRNKSTAQHKFPAFGFGLFYYKKTLCKHSFLKIKNPTHFRGGDFG